MAELNGHPHMRRKCTKCALEPFLMHGQCRGQLHHHRPKVRSEVRGTLEKQMHGRLRVTKPADVSGVAAELRSHDKPGWHRLLPFLEGGSGGEPVEAVVSLDGVEDLRLAA